MVKFIMEALDKGTHLLLLTPSTTAPRPTCFLSLSRVYRWPAPYYPLVRSALLGFCVTRGPSTVSGTMTIFLGKGNLKDQLHKYGNVPIFNPINLAFGPFGFSQLDFCFYRG